MLLYPQWGDNSQGGIHRGRDWHMVRAAACSFTTLLFMHIYIYMQYACEGWRLTPPSIKITIYSQQAVSPSCCFSVSPLKESVSCHIWGCWISSVFHGYFGALVTDGGVVGWGSSRRILSSSGHKVDREFSLDSSSEKKSYHWKFMIPSNVSYRGSQSDDGFMDL